MAFIHAGTTWFRSGTQTCAGLWLDAFSQMLERLTMAEVVAHDQALKQYLVERLKAIEGLTLYGGLEPHVGGFVCIG